MTMTGREVRDEGDERLVPRQQVWRWSTSSRRRCGGYGSNFTPFCTTRLRLHFEQNNAIANQGKGGKLAVFERRRLAARRSPFGIDEKRG